MSLFCGKLTKTEFIIYKAVLGINNGGKDASHHDIQRLLVREFGDTFKAATIDRTVRYMAEAGKLLRVGGQFGNRFRCPIAYDRSDQPGAQRFLKTFIPRC